MKTIFNFGHPLSGRAIEEIGKAVGENVIANIRATLSLNQSIGEQMTEICRQAVETFGQPDYLILPLHPLAAVWVDRYFCEVIPPHVVYLPIIRLVQLAGATPPVYVLGGIEQ
jgi:hypothetical protein